MKYNASEWKIYIQFIQYNEIASANTELYAANYIFDIGHVKR